MLILEGLKIASCSMGITEEMIDEELLIIMQSITKEDQ
jgi:hypothetical protein